MSKHKAWLHYNMYIYILYIFIFCFSVPCSNRFNGVFYSCCILDFRKSKNQTDDQKTNKQTKNNNKKNEPTNKMKVMVILTTSSEVHFC